MSTPGVRPVAHTPPMALEECELFDDDPESCMEEEEEGDLEPLSQVVASCPYVLLNVGGDVHQVLWRTLDRLPNSRLGRLKRCRRRGDLGTFCDDTDVPKRANGRPVRIFFDRHAKSFGCILNYYRSGTLHLSDEFCVIGFADELRFWGLDENLLEPCCLHRYHQKQEAIYDELKKEEELGASGTETAAIPQETFGQGKMAEIRKKLWDLLENPQTSTAARVS